MDELENILEKNLRASYPPYPNSMIKALAKKIRDAGYHRHEKSGVYVDVTPIPECLNNNESYGQICVRCNRCKRWDITPTPKRKRIEPIDLRCTHRGGMEKINELVARVNELGEK